MRVLISLAAAGLTLALTGCQTISSDQTIAEYCAASDNASEAICRLKVDVDGNATALSETQLSVEEARRLAEAAQASADEAASAAASAQETADTALSRAEQALETGDLECMTQTINQSDTGTCPAGYTVMGCEQTRYTHRAGGLSFLREVTNEQCRFNSQVLEMDVRCCRAADAAAQQTDAPENY